VTTRIFLARHGLAAYETELITDDGGSLTDQGREQARALGERMAAAGVTAVWCSPLSRAVQTAEIAAGVLGVGVTVREALREYGVGALAGTAGSETDTLGPVFAAWEAGDDGARIPGGETVSGIVARMTATLAEIADGHPDGTVLVVGHGGAIMATVPELTGRPRRTAWELVLDGGAYVELVRDDADWTVVSVVT
jgi:2,3-bisphosphoglycerate-dependent phosphoglycerate mutase